MLFDTLRRKKRIRRSISNVTPEKLQDIRLYIDGRTAEIYNLEIDNFESMNFMSSCEEVSLRESSDSRDINYTIAQRPIQRLTLDQMPTAAKMSTPMACPSPMLQSEPKPSYSEKRKKTTAKSSSVNEYVEKLENQEILTFGEYLQQLINKKGMTNKEVYFESNLSKQYFSKLINNRLVAPAKEKLLCIAVAMKLNMDETRDFLLHAGYAISPYSKIDLVFEYFINSGNYDIYEISYTLEELGIEGGLWPELAV